MADPTFDFVANPDTGELEIVDVSKLQNDDKSTNLQTQQNQDNNQQQNQPDQFQVLNTRIDQLVNSNNQMQQIIFGLLNKGNNQEEETVFDPEATESLFGDQDKGQKFLTGLVAQIEKIVDNKFKGLQPLVNQQNVQNEFQQLASMAPDIQEYIPGMYQALNINGNLSFAQAYQLAKQLGWRVQPNQNNNQQKQNQQQNNNVTDITKRNLPSKVRSDNPQLNGTDKGSDNYSLKKALEDAADELGIAM